MVYKEARVGEGERCQPCSRSDGPAASHRPREDALLQAKRLYYRLRMEYLEEDLLTKAARNGILSGMLECCYKRSERDLARLRMALEQLEEENRNR